MPNLSMNTTESRSQIELRLLGQRIFLKSEGDPERIREVVALVSGRIEAAERRAPGRNPAPHHVALLALLDLAEDYVQAKRKLAEHQLELEGRARELIQALEEAVGTSEHSIGTPGP